MKIKENRKVAIYARVSTIDNQEYDRQISDLMKVISTSEFRDCEVEIFAEKLSGYNRERPALLKMLENAEQFKSIYVTEISRLGRNPSHTRHVIDELSNKRIPVFIQTIGYSTLNSDGSRNPIMNIILQVIMEFAHLEAETSKSRMKSGKIQKVKEGGVHGANLAYGYTNVDKKLVVDEGEASVVRKIFKLSSEGIGAELIAKRLNTLDIPTKRALTHKQLKIKGTEIKKDTSTLKWNYNVVHQILKNSIYCGKRIYKGETYPCPAIINEELFRACNEGIKKRANKRDVTYTYLLKNLIYCGICGKKMMGRYQPTIKASKNYLCTSSIRSNECSNSKPYLLYTETVFYHLFLSTDLTKYLENPDEIKKSLVVDLENINLEIEGLKISIKALEEKKNRIAELYVDDSIDKDKHDEMKNVVVNDLNGLKSKLHILNDKRFDIKIALSNYEEENASLNLIEKAKENRQELRTIFKQMIDKVIVNKINERYTLLTYYVKVKGIVLPHPLKIFIDLKSATRNKRTSERHFKYIALKSICNEPVFKENILMIEAEEIEKELNYMIDYANLPYPMNLYQVVDIPKENWLTISESDI